MTRRYLLLILVGLALPVLSAQEIYVPVESMGTSSTITRADVSSGVQETLVSGLVWPQGLALDVPGGKMYWIEYPDQIWRAELDGSMVESLIGGFWFSGTSTSLAVDSAGGKMYWTGLTSVYRANLDGSALQNLGGPPGITLSGGLAVDANGGKVYYSGIPAAVPIDPIYRANLDGTNIEVVYQHPTMVIGALALDLPRSRIYFTDQTMGGIYSVTLSGTSMTTLLFAPRPVALAVDTQEEKLYWADNGTMNVQRCDLSGTGLEIVGSFPGWPTGLGVADGPPAPPAPPPVPCGDCTQDGSEANILDALRAAQIASGNGDPAPSCDVNGSGRVDILDSLLIARFAAHLTANFTCP